jgi:hypothetical protein
MENYGSGSGKPVYLGSTVSGTLFKIDYNYLKYVFLSVKFRPCLLDSELSMVQGPYCIVSERGATKLRICLDGFFMV